MLAPMHFWHVDRLATSLRTKKKAMGYSGLAAVWFFELLSNIQKCALILGCAFQHTNRRMKNKKRTTTIN